MSVRTCVSSPTPANTGFVVNRKVIVGDCLIVKCTLGICDGFRNVTHVLFLQCKTTVYVLILNHNMSAHNHKYIMT
jgi:hypothetical protein